MAKKPVLGQEGWGRTVLHECLAASQLCKGLFELTEHASVAVEREQT
jgi:hypothetical protein